ncbi:MAG: hypothetical protein AAF368_13705, partial [Planctomycetota bacterium]
MQRSMLTAKLPVTLTVFTALSIGLCSMACVTVKKDGSPLDPPAQLRSERDGPWLKGSPALQQSIEDNAQRLPWTHDMERVEMIQWFAQVGEPAFPKLLELAQDPRSDVAGSAYAALGATQDSRLVEPLRRTSLPADAAPDLELERARALLRLGDWSVIPVLIDGLEDEGLWRRSNSARALWEAT